MPAAKCFLYARCWEGFEDHFPYNEFNHLPETEIAQALEAYKSKVLAERKAEIKKAQRNALAADRVLLRGRREQSSFPPRSHPSIYTPSQLADIERASRWRQARESARKRRERARAKVCGWATRTGIWSPSPRLWLAGVESEDLAQQVVELCRERIRRTELHDHLCLNLQFGGIPESQLTPSERREILGKLKLSLPPAATDQEKGYARVRQMLQEEAEEVLELLRATEPTIPASPARSSSPIREPSRDAITAFRAYKMVGGENQYETARLLSRQMGRRIHQGTVSRWVNHVRTWLEAGNILPNLDTDPPRRPEVISVDPAKLDYCGPRSRRRTRIKRGR